MEIERVTVSGICGNGGREYRVYYTDGRWLSFDSMPGDRELYQSHTSSFCGLPDAPITLDIDKYAKQAHELLVTDVVGKYDQPTTIYFAVKMKLLMGKDWMYANLDNTTIQAQIDHLKAEKEELLDALGALADEQNGPPLIKYADQWQAAFDKATTILAKARDNNPQTK